MAQSRLPSPAADNLLGRRLGGCVELRALLGAGGMGRVYKGWHLTTEQWVAVKVLAPGADPTSARRLQFEVAAARRIKHPHSVLIVDAGTDPELDLFYVVMEYLEGRDLAKLVPGGTRLPVAKACAVVRDVLEALAEAHALEVVHRDVKLSNVMVLRGKPQAHVGAAADQVKLVDFGLAKVVGQTAVTQSGFTVGTPGFMAPEQALGEPLDGRADVYACGVMLYRLLTGRMPFPGEGMSAVARALKEDAPPVAGAPAELDRVVRWAMAREVADRCPSAQALSAALAPFAAGAEREPSLFDGGSLPALPTEPVRAAAAGRAQAPTVLASPVFDEAQSRDSARPTRATQQPSRARWPMVAAAGAALVITFLVGGMLALSPTERWALVARVMGHEAPPPPARTLSNPPTSTVRLWLLTNPVAARVFFGDQPLGSTPLTMIRDRGTALELRFAAHGYRPEHRVVQFLQDGELLVTLQPVGVGEPAPDSRSAPEME